MNSVGAVDHLLVIFRTTAGRGFLFALNGLTHGALLQAHFLDCFRLVSERGVVFPKAKYGVILAIIIIIVVNVIYYKETIFSFFK